MFRFPYGAVPLFCPADRPDRLSKTLALADLVIADLEDSVASERKNQAREGLRNSNLDPERTIVRTNPSFSPHFARDCTLLRDTPFRTIMLPKCERSPDDLGLRGFNIIPLCETARGVANLPDVLEAQSVVGVMWGEQDFLASIGAGGHRTPASRGPDVVRHARSQVLLEAAAHALPALDAVFVDITDDEGLAASALDAASSGFAAKPCVHPRQIEIVRSAFTVPTADVDWARTVLANARQVSGASVTHGEMIDEPRILQARNILKRSGLDPDDAAGSP